MAGKEDAGDFREDRRAMSILLRAVPPELIRTLGGKETTKEAWETLKVMWVGVQRVREAKAQTRWTEFEKLAFRDGEGVESFGIRLTAIVNDLEVLGDPVTEHKAVLKFFGVCHANTNGGRGIGRSSQTIRRRLSHVLSWSSTPEKRGFRSSLIKTKYGNPATLPVGSSDRPQIGVKEMFTVKQV